MTSDWKITACPHDCPCACSMRARFSNGKIEIEPYLANPHTKFICAKGLRWRERALSSRRLQKPLLRDGANFREISWNEAWNIWAKKIDRAVEKHGELSLMYLTGAGSLYYSQMLIKSFFGALGGYTGTTGSLCAGIGYAGVDECKVDSALSAFVPPEKLTGAKGVLFWGKNAWENQPQLIPILNATKAQLGSIEIRESATVKKCDKFWRVLPGGDWAIAAWLCQTLIKRGLDDANWRARAENAAEFEKYVLSLDPQILLSASGFSGESAEELLNWIISNAPVCHFPAYGAQRYLHGDLQFSWIFALCVLTGAFENVAAGFAGGKDERALFPDELRISPKNLRTFPIGNWASRTETDPIEILMITNANPVRQTPDTGAVKNALAKIPFKVCNEIFLTETAEMCDLVLPTCTFLEDSDWLGSYWHSYVVHSEAVMPAFGESKTDVEIYDGLAKILGIKINLAEKKCAMDNLIIPNLQKIGERIYFYDEPNYWTEKNSRAQMPNRVPRTELSSENLRLVTVHRAEYINGQSDDASCVSTPPEIFLSPETIKKYNLKIGQVSQVSSPNGYPITMRVEEDASLADNVAVAYQGQRGINLLTNARDVPGNGAPYSECVILLEATK